MKSNLYLLLGIASTSFMLSGCTTIILGYKKAQDEWRSASIHGPKHVFSVQPVPPFLTEELALAKARESLTKEGYNLSEWQLTKVGDLPTKALHGTTDNYFERWSFEPLRGNGGSVLFKKGERYRVYHVRLERNRVICSPCHGCPIGPYKSE